LIDRAVNHLRGSEDRRYTVLRIQKKVRPRMQESGNIVLFSDVEPQQPRSNGHPEAC
jgi:hypothetical protein